MRNLSFFLLLTALLGAAYANSFGTDFVLDNVTIILDNPALREWNSENLYFIVTKNYWAPSSVSNLYRPVTTLTYAINYCLLGNGTSPFGYHVVNFLLHWINSIAVFFLVRRFTESFIAAGLTTIVFAVHPLVTEAVTNIVGRADLLMTMFVLMGLHLHLNFRAMHGWMRIGSWLGLFIAAFLSVFSKESGVVLLGLMLVWDLVQNRREQSSTTLNAVYKHLRAGGWQPYIPVVASLSVLVFARHAILWRLPDLGQPSVDNPLIMADFWTARMTAIRVIGNYCVLFVWPAKLSCDYSFNQIPLFSWSFANTSDIVTWLSLVWLAIMLGILGWAWSRLHSAFYFLAFFFIAISPVANLFFISGTIMGERLMYLPNLGLIAFLALVLEAIGKWLSRKYPTHFASVRPFIALVLGVAVLLLVARTYIRNRDWQTEFTLWSSAIKNVPNNVKAYKGLSIAMFRDKNIEWPIDEIIGIAERGIAIVESHNLEPRYLPTNHYVDLGHFYNYKAFGLS